MRDFSGRPRLIAPGPFCHGLETNSPEPGFRTVFDISDTIETKAPAMKIRSHPESHIVELEDGSRWRIFPGDLDLTLSWQPETDLAVVQMDDSVSSISLVSRLDGSRVRVIPAGHEWPAKDAKSVLKEG